MPRIVRIAVKMLLAFTATIAFALSVIWPWPAPEVDWRAPVEAALAKNDCERAAALVNAATSAGSIEAYEMLSKPASLAPCFYASTLRMHPDTRAESLSASRRDPTLGRIVLTQNTEVLDFWLRHYVRTIDFLCRQPYDQDIRTDDVALSAALPEEAGWLMALHRQRRRICIGMVEDLATALAERDEPQAIQLAYEFALGGPVTGSTTSAVVLAALFLQRQFVTRGTRNDPHVQSLMRGGAWLSLQLAAEAHDPHAIELMISLLHQGRFVQNAGALVGSQKKAYFWVLRSRRLGLPAAPIHAEIENALNAEERATVKGDEEYYWKRLAPSSAR